MKQNKLAGDSEIEFRSGSDVAPVFVVFGANVCPSRRKVVILQQIRKKDVRYQKDKGGFPHTVEGGL